MTDIRYETSQDYRDGYDLGREHGRAEVYRAASKELELVRALSLPFDKPGLRQAAYVIRNLEQAMKLGIQC